MENKKQLIENKIRTIVKKVMKEADFDVTSNENKLFNLRAFFKSMYEYTNNKEKNLDVNFVINSLQKQIKLLKR